MVVFSLVANDFEEPSEGGRLIPHGQGAKNVASG